MDPSWLRWAKGLQAIAQNGLTFATDAYDRERYRAVRGVAAEMMAAGSETDTESVLELFARETGYATPKVDVRGAVFRGDIILLVREASDGRWSLPGGWADVNGTAKTRRSMPQCVRMPCWRLGQRRGVEAVTAGGGGIAGEGA